MKLITYDKPTIDNIPVVNLKSVILLFVADYDPNSNDDAGAKSVKQYIKCVYAAYDEYDKIHLFVQYYTYGPDEADKVEKMKKSSYYDGSFNSYQLITTINFFTGTVKPENTDFYCRAREDGMYEFYAFGNMSGNSITYEEPTIYVVNDKIKLGLEILHSIIGTASLQDAGIIEANIWMYNESNEQYDSYKNLYKHEKASSYTIKDISKSTKKNKHLYIGAVAIEIITTDDNDDGSVYTTIMPYRRTEHLRRKDLTMDLGLMEKTYEGAYTIGSYGAAPMSPDESDIYRIIAYSDKLKRYVVLDFTQELHDKLCDEINSIE